MRRTHAVAVAALATALALTGVVSTSASAASRPGAATSSSHQAPSAAGAWRMLIDPAPNPAGDPPPFPSRIAFARGGVVTGAASTLPPGFVSGSAVTGAWHQHHRTVTFTFELFLSDATGFAAIQQVKGTLTVGTHGDTISGPATATILAKDGTTVLRKFDVAASGTRLTP